MLVKEVRAGPRRSEMMGLRARAEVTMASIHGDESAILVFVPGGLLPMARSRRGWVYKNGHSITVNRLAGQRWHPVFPAA